jgi:hypothetical protein
MLLVARPYGADVGVGALGSARCGFEKQRQHPTSVQLLATKRQGGEIALPNFASFAGALRVHVTTIVLPSRRGLDRTEVMSCVLLDLQE